jgi:cell division protein FtsL
MREMSHAISAAGAGVRTVARPRSRRRWAWWQWLNSFSLVGLCLVILAGSLFHVWQHIHVVRQGYGLERLREVHAKLVQENKALRLEAGQLRSLRRVEEIARTRLGMVTPKPGQVALIPESPIQ